MAITTTNHAERFDIESELNDYVGESIKSVALNFLRIVTFASPVDTGRFRANWTVGVNSPDDNNYQNRRSAQSNIARQSRAIKALNATPLTVIYISNNLPYARRLNNGWSKQAPKFFVEQAARRAGINIKDGIL
jgi:hypothetical protein